jgi:hypothetical protein
MMWQRHVNSAIIMCRAVRFIKVSIQSLNNLSSSVLVSHGDNFAFIMGDLIKPLTVLGVINKDIQFIGIVKGDECSKLEIVMEK